MSSVVEQMPKFKRIEYSLRAECVKCGKIVYHERASEEPDGDGTKEVSHSVEIAKGQTADKLHCNCTHQEGAL